MAKTLMRAGDASATWLITEPTTAATLDQGDFTQLPMGRLRSLMTATYGSDLELATAFGREGGTGCFNLFNLLDDPAPLPGYPPFPYAEPYSTMFLTDGKPNLRVVYGGMGADTADARLLVTLTLGYSTTK